MAQHSGSNHSTTSPSTSRSVSPSISLLETSPSTTPPDGSPTSLLVPLLVDSPSSSSRAAQRSPSQRSRNSLSVNRPGGLSPVNLSEVSTRPRSKSSNLVGTTSPRRSPAAHHRTLAAESPRMGLTRTKTSLTTVASLRANDETSPRNHASSMTLPRPPPLDTRPAVAPPEKSPRLIRTSSSSSFQKPVISLSPVEGGSPKPLLVRPKSVMTSPRARPSRPRPEPPPFLPKSNISSPSASNSTDSPSSSVQPLPKSTTSLSVSTSSKSTTSLSVSTNSLDTPSSLSPRPPLEGRRGSGSLMRVMLPQEGGGGFLTIKCEAGDSLDAVMARVLQHTNSKRVGRRSSLVFTNEDFELSSTPSAPAGDAIPSNPTTLYLRYTSENDMCIQVGGLRAANGRLIMVSDSGEVRANGAGCLPNTRWRISRAPRHAVYFQDVQNRYLCCEPDGRVFMGVPGPATGWGQELWTIHEEYLVNVSGKYLSTDSVGSLTCGDSKSESKLTSEGSEILEGYVNKCGLFRGNNPVLLYFVLTPHGLSTYTSKEAYLLARNVHTVPALPFVNIAGAQLDNNSCCLRLHIKDADLSLQHLMCRSPHEATIWLRALNKQPILSSQISSILALWQRKLPADNAAVFPFSNQPPTPYVPASATSVVKHTHSSHRLSGSPIPPPPPPRRIEHSIVPRPPPACAPPSVCQTVVETERSSAPGFSSCSLPGRSHPTSSLTHLASGDIVALCTPQIPPSPTIVPRRLSFPSTDPSRESVSCGTSSPSCHLSCPSTEVGSASRHASVLEANSSRRPSIDESSRHLSCSSEPGSSGPRSSLEAHSLASRQPSPIATDDLAIFNVPTRARRASLVPPPPPINILPSKVALSDEMRLLRDASAPYHVPTSTSPTVNKAALAPSSTTSSTTNAASASSSCASTSPPTSRSSCSYLYSSFSSFGFPSAASSQLFGCPSVASSSSGTNSAPPSPESVSFHGLARGSVSSITSSPPGSPILAGRDLSRVERQQTSPVPAPRTPLRSSALETMNEAALRDYILNLQSESVTLRSVLSSKQRKLQHLAEDKEAALVALQQMGPKAAVALQRERQRRYRMNEELAMKIVQLKNQLRTLVQGFDVEDVSLSDSAED